MKQTNATNLNKNDQQYKEHLLVFPADPEKHTPEIGPGYLPAAHANHYPVHNV